MKQAIAVATIVAVKTAPNQKPFSGPANSPDKIMIQKHDVSH